MAAILTIDILKTACVLTKSELCNYAGCNRDHRDVKTQKWWSWRKRLYKKAGGRENKPWPGISRGEEIEEWIEKCYGAHYHVWIIISYPHQEQICMSTLGSEFDPWLLEQCSSLWEHKIIHHWPFDSTFLLLHIPTKQLDVSYLIPR